MRKIILLALCFVYTSIEAQGDNQVWVCGDDISFVLLYGGVQFRPANEASNKSDTVLCDIYIEQFYLNDLQLNKQQFIGLNLASPYLRNDSTTIFNRGSSKRGYGTYEYKYDGRASCANKIDYIVSVKLPIFLNGVELKTNEQETELAKITPPEILSVERKSSLFGGGEIYIKTKSHP